MSVTVLVVRVGEEPKLETIKGDLQSMYNTVGRGCDLVQCVPVGNQVELWVDEEGKFRGTQPLNFWLRGADGTAYDNVMGNAFFTGPPDEEGELVDITAEQAAAAKALVEAGRA